MRRTVSLALLYAIVSAPAWGQSYPTRPIRVVVPFPAGGGTDIVARIVMRKVTDGIGGTAVIDNRAGAGGTIGTDLVVKAPADGYTIGIVSGDLIESCMSDRPEPLAASPRSIRAFLPPCAR